jgi:hypothetical protein
LIWIIDFPYNLAEKDSPSKHPSRNVIIKTHLARSRSATTRGFSPTIDTDLTVRLQNRRGKEADNSLHFHILS